MAGARALAVRYFTSERDGPDVNSAVLDRQPANLTDENAYVYADPAYDSNDNLLGTLKKIGGPVDVSGGWFDAGGGYEKFAYTASFTDGLMLLAARDLALGANGWGTSFVVGAGTVFPHCMQSEIANLAGSLTGTGHIQLGAATDGPSAPANFSGLGTVSGMRACAAGNFAPFNTRTAGYEDSVVSWPSVEPADDYTADSLLAFALGADSGPGLG